MLLILMDGICFGNEFQWIHCTPCIIVKSQQSKINKHENLQHIYSQKE